MGFLLSISPACKTEPQTVSQREGGAVNDLILTDCCFWAREKSGVRQWGGERGYLGGLLIHPAITPLTAPQYGHIYKEKGHKRTVREAGPSGSLLPQHSALREEFAFQLPHKVSVQMMVMKVTNIKGEKYTRSRAKNHPDDLLPFPLPDFPDPLLV